MPLSPPVFFPNIGYRWVCDGCGERWREDNIDECVNCKRDICPNCGGFVSFPGRKPDEWWCDRCANARRAKVGVGPGQSL
jgi:hypothetical protein